MGGRKASHFFATRMTLTTYLLYLAAVVSHKGGDDCIPGDVGEEGSEG